MARAIWSGSISFGLVNVPIKVYSAVREHTVHFHQIERGTGSRIRYEKVSEQSGQEVATKDIELGYELAKGRLVTVDPADLTELQPRTTKTIDISDFVDLSEIDPVYYNRSYWLGPDGAAAERPYSLLVHAMEERRRAGIGMVVIRNKQYLAAIRPRDGALAMSTMYFADEVVAKDGVPGLPSRKTTPPPAERRLAVQIIDALRTDWDPARYQDTYTDRMKELSQRQAEGKQLVAGEESPGETRVVDLMVALEASLRSAGGRGGRRPRSRSGSPPRSRKTEEGEDKADAGDHRKVPARSRSAEPAPGVTVPGSVPGPARVRNGAEAVPEPVRTRMKLPGLGMRWS